MGLYFTHISILAKTLVGLNIELGYGYKIVFFNWLKKCTGISEFFLVNFLTLDGQPLPIMSEKSPFVRAGFFSESHTVPIY